MEKKQPPANIRSLNDNIIIKVPTLRDRVRALGDSPTKLKIFELFMNQNMFQGILHWTNIEKAKFEKNTTRTVCYLSKIWIL